VRVLPRFPKNRRQYRIKIISHIRVSETDDANAASGEDLTPPLVVRPSVAVLVAVQLDSELRLHAIEVDDEPVDRHLTAELQAVELAVADRPPEEALGVGVVVTHDAGEATALPAGIAIGCH
jgi:hypothetical protein